MEKNIEVKCECPKSDITSMTEAFFGFKPGTLSARKFSIEDQEFKWGDERHREDRGNEESSEEADKTE
jgi:hypothetical protein